MISYHFLVESKVHELVMKNLIKKIVTKLSPIMVIIKERGRLMRELRQKYQFVPPGHFYSPIPSIDEIKQDEEKIFMIPNDLPGVDLNKEEQIRMFNEL